MSNILILHGDDEYSIDEFLHRTIAEFRRQPNADFNFSEFDGTETTPAEILGAASAFPFLSESRLIAVKGILTYVNRKGGGDAAKKMAEQLADSLASIPPTTRLIFVERVKLPDSHRVLKAAPKDSMRFFAAPKDSTQWIIKHAKAQNVEIEPAAARALSLITASDLRLADSELAKLAAYTNSERPITEKDVMLLTPYVAETNLFAMTDALSQGNSREAATLAHRLLAQNEDAIALFGMIVRQFRLLLLVKEHLAGGGDRSSSAIAGAIGIHPYAAEKLSAQSRAFSIPQLEQIYRALQEYDVRMKTGRIDAELALDLLIAALAKTA
ncbi:MAG: DNA polymerase III subunit delta [Chloroflexi bacterium OLB15]|nr:MAG: DNA polymerase III subunit delta [Chloroflexi bacterium OLB15]